MVTKECVHSCEFNRLFTKSVPHLLEGIFFSLDYDSFAACRDVCKAWKELHSSELYQRKAEELSERKRDNEKKLCQYSQDGKYREVWNLLTKGVNPNCADTRYGDTRYGGSPLHYATSQGHQNVVELLLNMGADSNLANKGGCTPQHLAAISNNEDIFKLLINKGANPNVADMNGQTPIHFTEINDQKDVVKMFLEAGADTSKKDSNGPTPLSWANK